VKYIEKRKAPDSLVEWIAANKGLPNFEYKNLPSEVREELERSLVEEQFCLCAYTEIRIAVGDCHIEHMLPQSVCLTAALPEKTVDYSNLVACYPKPPRRGDPEPEFGARFKDQWPSVEEEKSFLKPTDPSCEDRIQYRKDGSVHPSDPLDANAEETISRLGLRNDPLALWRREAISEIFQDAGGRKPTRQSINARLRSLQTPKDGKLDQFYSAKRQCLARKIESWR
jgi:uncharacterized protein (TIGR02646 family)